MLGYVRCNDHCSVIWGSLHSPVRLGQVQRPLFGHMGEFAQARLGWVRCTRPGQVGLDFVSNSEQNLTQNLPRHSGPRLLVTSSRPTDPNCKIPIRFFFKAFPKAVCQKKTKFSTDGPTILPRNGYIYGENRQLEQLIGIQTLIFPKKKSVSSPKYIKSRKNCKHFLDLYKFYYSDHFCSTSANCYQFPQAWLGCCIYQYVQYFSSNNQQWLKLLLASGWLLGMGNRCRSSPSTRQYSVKMQGCCLLIQTK